MSTAWDAPHMRDGWRGVNARSDVDWAHLLNRWQLYLPSASEPVVLLLLLASGTRVRSWAAVLLVIVVLAHTAACLRLLHVNVGRLLDGPLPGPVLWLPPAALTAAAAVAAFATFPRPDSDSGAFVLGESLGGALLLVTAALAASLAPLLTPRYLVVAILGPAVLLAAVQPRVGGAVNVVWAMNYAIAVGTFAFGARWSAWFFGVTWKLDQGREAQARLAVAEERLRFSRDLHDVLGRNLAVIAVSSELAAELARRGQPGAVDHMLQVQTTAQESMREVREVVSGYRSADLAGELAGARALLRAAGIRTRVIGDGSGMPPSVQAALGWVVREATTNIIRHSAAHAVTIEVGHEATAHPPSQVALLIIDNDGALPLDTQPVASGGTGLLGLAERIAALGGRLTAEPSASGRFRIEARIPLPAPGCAPASRMLGRAPAGSRAPSQSHDRSG